MDPRFVGFLAFLILVFPGFLTQLEGQVREISSMISDLGSHGRMYDLELPVYSKIPDPPEMAEVHPDCKPVYGHTAFIAKQNRSAGFHDPSILLMVRGLLSKKEVILDYYPSDTLIRVMAITNESCHFYTVHSDCDFWSILKQYLRRIKLAELFDYRQQPQCLGEVLLGAVSPELAGKSKIIIIAREGLSGFPFEILVNRGKEAASGLKKKLLVESREIVYNKSLDQWLSSRIRNLLSEAAAREGNSLAFAGFSPGMHYNDHFQVLPHARNEIIRIGEMFRESGKTHLLMLSEHSNKNNFMEVAPLSEIIHIATHSYISMEIPETNGLLLTEYSSVSESQEKSDGLLAVNEICDMKIPADLIVLDACSSANLMTRIGMNWLSCAECFMKAGAKNILCTLWNVNDRFAEHFMIEFYRNYLRGMSFSKALQQVKISMIQDPSTALPLNWSAYILIGE